MPFNDSVIPFQLCIISSSFHIPSIKIPFTYRVCLIKRHRIRFRPSSIIPFQEANYFILSIYLALSRSLTSEKTRHSYTFPLNVHLYIYICTLYQIYTVVLNIYYTIELKIMRHCKINSSAMFSLYDLFFLN